MSAQHDPGSGTDGGPDHLEVAPSPPGARRLLLLTGALLVLALVLVVALTRSQQGSAPAPTSPPTVTGPASSPPGVPSASSPGSSPDRPSPRPGEDVGGPVRGRLPTAPWPEAGTDWELFAQDSRDLYRIALATGEVTRTPVRIASAPGTRAAFVTGPDGALVRSAESDAAVFVPDDAPAVEVALGEDPGTLPEVLPGPPGLVWVVAWDPDTLTATARTHRLSGAAVGEPVTVTGTPFGGVVADGSGGLLAQGAGGAWELSDPPRRVTRGAVLATGPRTHVYLDCDPARVCSRFVRDVATDRTRRLGPAADGEGLQPARGQTSPDGRRAVLPRPSGPVLDVVDLATGEVGAGVSLEPGADPANSLVWTPDSRSLLVLEDDGVSRVDAVTGERSALALEGVGQGLRRLTLRS